MWRCAWLSSLACVDSCRGSATTSESPRTLLQMGGSLPFVVHFVSLDHCCLDTLCSVTLRLAVATGSCCLVQRQCYHLRVDSPALAVADRGGGSPSSSTSLASTIAVLTLYAVWRCAWLPPLAHVASCRSKTTTSESARPQCQWPVPVGEGSASSPTSLASTIAVLTLYSLWRCAWLTESATSSLPVTRRRTLRLTRSADSGSHWHC